MLTLYPRIAKYKFSIYSLLLLAAYAGELWLMSTNSRTAFS
jgi:hypothetical protein